MDGGLFPEPKIKTGQIKNPSCLNLSVQTGGIFLLCEIIGMITEIVSNQYHLLVLIRKVIALQRLFNFFDYSHSIVPMGLGVRSRQTRLMPSTSWVMRSVILCSTA